MTFSIQEVHGFIRGGMFFFVRFLRVRLCVSRLRSAEMRWTLPVPHPRKRYAPAIGALLYAVSHGATASLWEYSVPTSIESGKDWLCHTEVQRGNWYIRCNDLAAILNDDPVLENTVDLPPSKLIPIYSAPFADSPLRLLAESVLCGGDQSCNVVFAESQ